MSVNSAAVSQRFWSTTMRRAQGNTPPKPYMPTDRNPRNSRNNDGGAGASGIPAGYFARRHGTNPAAPCRTGHLVARRRRHRAGGLSRRTSRHDVPIDLIAGHLLVTVQVNGADATFILDTGADRTLMGEDAVRRLGLERSGWVASTVRGLGGYEERPNALPRSLRLGGVTLRRRTLNGDTSVTVGPLPVTEIAGQPIAGLLGRDFLAPFDLDIESARAQADAVRRARLPRRFPAVDAALYSDPRQHADRGGAGRAGHGGQPPAARAAGYRCQFQPDRGARHVPAWPDTAAAGDTIPAAAHPASARTRCSCVATVLPNCALVRS